MYFDQQIGAPHAVGWLKSVFLALKQVFLSFSIINWKKGNLTQKIAVLIQKQEIKEWFTTVKQVFFSFTIEGSLVGTRAY